MEAVKAVQAMATELLQPKLGWRLSPDAIAMTKNRYFCAWYRIRMPTVDVRPDTTNPSIDPWLRGGQITQGTAGGMARALTHPPGHAATIPSQL